MCSQDPIFRTNKESSIWRQNDHRDIMQNLLAPFIFQEERWMKIEHVLFPSGFSKLRIRVLEGHFQCVHTIRFSEPTKIGSLKTDLVNGPLGCAVTVRAYATYEEHFSVTVRYTCSTREAHPITRGSNLKYLSRCIASMRHSRSARESHTAVPVRMYISCE